MEEQLYNEARRSLISTGRYSFSHHARTMYSKDLEDIAAKIISRLEKEFSIDYRIDGGIIGPLDIRVWKVTNNVIEDWLD